MSAVKKPLIVCITGERCVKTFRNTISVVLDELQKITNDNSLDLQLIFGDCSGVDTDAKELCIEKNINYKVYPADWKLHGKAAGPIRNKIMVDLANVVYAFHTDITKSKGTKNTIKLAKEKGIVVKLFTKEGISGPSC